MSGEIRKWADEAMFESEPMPEAARRGPQVHLLSMSADPLGQIAAAAMMYEGKVVRTLSDVTHEQRRRYFEQLQSTKLKAPFEFVKFHFMIEGVTRSFTHQMVRQRTAVFAQESMRFAVKDNLDEETPLPPSMYGLRDDDPRVVVWRKAINNAQDAYTALVEAGVPAEDARGLMPHQVTTRLHYSTDLRALQDHAGNRLCTQAQFEWRLVFSKISEAIREYRPHAATLESAGGNINPEEQGLLYFLDESDRWQYEAISDLFRPVCYLTGKCEFRADFDRKCSIRDRVDDNARSNVPSSKWHLQHPDQDGQPILPILPHEWLLDPTAAR